MSEKDIGFRYKMRRGIFRLFFLGFVRLHVLYHAAKQEVWGSWLKEELFRHGYDISPGTLYPVLHELERENLIRSKREKKEGKWVKVYRITEKGKMVLKEAQDRVKELVEEVLSGEEEQEIF